MLANKPLRQRRLWAKGVLLAAMTCLAASAMIWGQHAIQKISTGRIVHNSIATLIGIKSPWLQTSLCLLLPIAGFLLLYTFVAIWTVGVHRRAPAERSSGEPIVGYGPAAQVDHDDDEPVAVNAPR